MIIMQRVCLQLLLTCSVPAWADTRAPLPSPNPLETSLSQKACRQATTVVRESYAARGLDVVRCPAPQGITLLLVSSQAHSWIDLIVGKTTWSSEQAVVYRPNPGMFPNVIGHITWLKGNNNKITGFVFSVASQDENYRKVLTHFGVRALMTERLICTFLHRSDAIQFAQTMPSDDTSCPDAIESATRAE